MFWELHAPFTDAMELRITLSLLIGGLLFLFLRPVFVYGIYLYGQGQATLNQVLLVGVFAELQPFSIYIPKILWTLFTMTPYTGFPPIFPIPLLLLVGLIVLKIIHQTDWKSQSVFPESG